MRLSAEPLVGLKRLRARVRERLVILSAEPLVGLKPQCSRQHRRLHRPFSRTPRGFEAISGDYSGFLQSFQPNPSWV